MLKSFSRFASKIPQWNGKNCLQCFSCALACPTSALRPFLLSKNEPSINAVNVTGKADEFFKIQVSPNDCIGCGKCLKTCPTSSLTMVERTEQVVRKEEEAYNKCLSLPSKPKIYKNANVNSENRKPYEFKGEPGTMKLYDAIKYRRVVRDFEDKVVPDEALKRIINAALQAPTHDHLRNWEFVVLQKEEDKKKALQFIAHGVTPQLEILKRVLVEGTKQQKMYAIAMPRQYTMLYNASHLILPFFKSDDGVMHPESVSSLNAISSIWCAIENLFLAATAEGLACSMRIPVGDEGPNVAKVVGAPPDYLLPVYIGLGYPAKDRPYVEQNEYTAEQRIHYDKW